VPEKLTWTSWKKFPLVHVEEAGPVGCAEGAGLAPLGVGWAERDPVSGAADAAGTTAGTAAAGAPERADGVSVERPARIDELNESTTRRTTTATSRTAVPGRTDGALTA